MMFIFGLLVGTVFGIFVVSLCAVAKRSDQESEIFRLRSKLHKQEYRNQPYPIEGAD